MPNCATTKPAIDEYAAYYGKYIDLVPAGSVIDTLRLQMTDTISMLGSLTAEQANHRYSPEKWSIKQVIGHLIDTERIFAYRALRFARNDKTPLPGFEQDDYVLNADFDSRSIGDLSGEYGHVRAASIDLFGHITEEVWDRRGTANQAEASVRALAWIIGGHELHHKEVIRTRYL